MIDVISLIELDSQKLISQCNEMQNFEVISKVGEGAFASVYKTKRKEDGQIYAMKKIKLAKGTDKDMKNTLNEIRILASINSPYIIAYKDAIFDEPSHSLLLITEFAAGGDLSRYIKNYQKNKELVPQSQIWKMAIQMLHGLKTLHRMNIFHRDIKSANILLTKNNEEIKLADLNVSKISKSGLASTQTGTPYYASPEVWSDLPYNGKCDIWSMGCVLYEMASFRPPFMAHDIHALKKKISAGVYDRIPHHYSEDLQNLIRFCLTVSTRDRPSAQGLLHHHLIRKRLYLFPNQKFNEPNSDLLNKENILIQTIRVPKYRLNSDLNEKLPPSKYENDSQLMRSQTYRNRSQVMTKQKSEEKLPELMHRNSSRDSGKEKCSIPRPRLMYLR